MWAIIPINSFKKTMTRLSEVLNANQRIKLTKLLTQQIIDHLLGIPEIEKIVLLTNETEWAQYFNDKKIILKANQDRLSLKENLIKLLIGYGNKVRKKCSIYQLTSR